MKEYDVLVSLGGGWCDGTMSVQANDCDEARNKARDLIATKLLEVFPSLEIDYDVEIFGEEDEIECNDEERCETCVHYSNCNVQNCGVCSHWYDVVKFDNYCDHWESGDD